MSVSIVLAGMLVEDRPVSFELWERPGSSKRGTYATQTKLEGVVSPVLATDV